MTVDLVVDRFSQLSAGGHNIGDGALAWCKLDQILAIQSELGGDWLPYQQASAEYYAPVSPVASGLLNNASVDVTVIFPPGKFTQSPIIEAITTNSSRLSVAVKPGPANTTKDKVVVRVSNFSGSTMSDIDAWIRVVAHQEFV